MQSCVQNRREGPSRNVDLSCHTLAYTNAKQCSSMFHVLPAIVVYLQVDVKGWLEAFEAHPKIGDIESLKKKFGGFAAMSKNEQSGAAEAAPAEIQVSCRNLCNL